ncbi:uncharacterized protein LOC142348302 [Convolutriloba macropyga]|uniref:uncharacterized protein LOC142348302 n=1 Tax=Convolutriloba macropyga TaxID=536237 RepID=UPI003F51C80E
MSYCGKKNIQDTLMYDGRVYHSLNRVPRLSHSANCALRTEESSPWWHRDVHLTPHRHLPLHRSADSTEMKFNDRSFLKSATEHEKLVIGDSLRKLDCTLTPARWRMKTMQDSLRHGWAHPTDNNNNNSKHQQINDRPADLTLKRSKSLMTEIPKTPSRSTIERERILRKPKQFVISPEWHSEYIPTGKGKNKPGEVVATAIIPQRDITTQCP